MRISIIISTYNRPDALMCVLGSLNQQDCMLFEVVVADDGSTEDTKLAIDQFREKAKYTIHHVWQKDEGFRLAQIRNKAVAKSSEEYLIFLDGDCVVFPDYISKHIELAELGYFVRGSRIMLSEDYTNEFIAKEIQTSDITLGKLFQLKLGKKINRILPLARLKLGTIRKLKKTAWYGAKGCNIAIWRSDYYAVDGFDERYVGWGREDSDIVIRLIRNNVYRKEGIYAVSVLHLWHKESDRASLTKNDDKIAALQNSNETRAKLGLSQYL